MAAVYRQGRELRACRAEDVHEVLAGDVGGLAVQGERLEGEGGWGQVDDEGGEGERGRRGRVADVQRLQRVCVCY